MSTPDKCPHCGAPADGSQVWFTCGTGTIGPTLLCQERSAHAETKAELAAIKARIAGDNSDNCPLCAEIGMDGHSQSVPMCRLCQLESELDALRQWQALGKATWRFMKSKEESSETLDEIIAKMGELIKREKEASRE